MKIGDRVLCVGYPHDKYNPLNIIGTIVSFDGEYNPIIVLWDNGIRNSYTEKNLRLATNIKD